MSLASRLRSLFAAPEEPARTVPSEPQGHGFEYYVDTYRVDQGEATPSIDDLINDKGLSIYREMHQRDDAIRSGSALLEYATLSNECQITAASEDEADKDIAAAVIEAFERAGGLLRYLEAHLEAPRIGFSCVEKRWMRDIDEWEAPSGKFYPIQWLRALVPMPQETIAVKRNSFGEIEPDGIWQSKSRQIVTPSLDPAFFNKFDARDFVLFSWSRQWDNPYGMSLLRPAYRWYTIKDRVVVSWVRYLERYGYPLPKVKVPKGTSRTERRAIASELSRQLNEQGVVLYDGTDIDFAELGHTATDSFRSAISESNRGILRALLQPALVMENEGTTGSNALGSSQINQTFAWPLENLRLHLVAEAVVRGVVEDFVRHNFGPRVKLPRVQFEEFVPRNLTALGQMIELAVRLGIPTPTSWAASILGVPTPGKDEEILGQLRSGSTDIEDPGLAMVAPGVVANGAAKVQDEGLNGAQISAISDLLGQVSRKEQSGDAVAGLLQQAFPRMDASVIDRMVKTAASFTPVVVPSAPPADVANPKERAQLQEWIDEFERALTSDDPAEPRAFFSGEQHALNGAPR